MSEPSFDAEGLFDEDYLYFYRGLTDERSDAEVELIRRLVNVRPGADVLDLACGHGRLANRLAAQGYRVTGLDSSRLFLDRARADAESRGVAVEFIEGDMRELPWSGRFDIVINWFTAFGYFPDEENRRVLDEVFRALRPGGVFALDLNNTFNLLRRYEETHMRRVGDDVLVDAQRLDPLTNRNFVERIIIRDGRLRRVPYYVRFFTFPEIRDWLRQAGFDEIEGYGGDGEPLTVESRRMIVVARR